jgi:putative transposase
MTKDFKNKYKIQSSRLSGYDYSQNGMYFVTICTKDREQFFGSINNGEISLSEIGKIVDHFWREIPTKFPFVKLAIYQIMPNHLHGIIEIINNDFVETRFIASGGILNGAEGIPPQFLGIPRVAINRASTRDGDNKKPGGVTGMHNPMLNQKSLSNIIRWFKGRCSFEIKRQSNSPAFAWQSRFHDHIIRDEKSLNKIREYISINPEIWDQDRNNPKYLRP